MKPKQRHTQEEIQGYIYAKSRKPGTIILKVTRTTYYAVRAKHYQKHNDEMIAEWFETNSPSAPLANRDGSIIYETFDEVEELERDGDPINVLDI